jgi:hypothetical protein
VVATLVGIVAIVGVGVLVGKGVAVDECVAVVVGDIVFGGTVAAFGKGGRGVAVAVGSVCVSTVA